MTASTIQTLHARAILDGRGRPTVEAEITLTGGMVARASAPSGASTGKGKAVELRDGGVAWVGRGVSRAVDNVRGEIARLLVGRDVLDQAALDAVMREADGTPNLARLGGNATRATAGPGLLRARGRLQAGAGRVRRRVPDRQPRQRQGSRAKKEHHELELRVAGAQVPDQTGTMR